MLIQQPVPSDQAPKTEHLVLPILMRILFSAGNKSVSGPAIFIDRDGVINCRRAGDYVLGWSQFAFMPDIFKALRELSNLRLPMIVISNQSAVGRGLLTSTTLQDITTHMQRTLLDFGICLSAVYFCTHSPEEHCLCRKPKPGLLQAAAADFDINLSRSIFIGDSDIDIQAALAVGCQPVLFGLDRNSSSDGMDWVTGIPAALTARELFRVAVDSLRIAEVGQARRSRVQDSGREG
jgi:D-glycero-D-manno-heptose 1,7-bisphosphate phosphatase